MALKSVVETNNVVNYKFYKADKTKIERRAFPFETTNFRGFRFSTEPQIHMQTNIHTNVVHI